MGVFGFVRLKQMAIRTELARLMEAREMLSRAESAALMRAVLASEASDLEIAAALGALGGRGVTPAELAGFAEAMRSAALSLDLDQNERAELVDTCGTGGDASGSFNISTAAALVAAAAGARVAKHGNRAVTSRCGSADVLEALGIPTHLTAGDAVTALRQFGFCFLLAPSHHPAMKAVLPVRRALGVRTVFHILGPLLNPAGAQRQVMGVYNRELVPLVAEAMSMLGTRHGMVVHGEGGLDELALSGPSAVAEVRDGVVQQWQVTPEDLGLERAPLSYLAGGDAVENASILRSVFAGENGPGVPRAQREVVLLNAAAVLLTAGRAATLPRGLSLAREAIDTGSVSALVHRLQTAGRQR